LARQAYLKESFTKLEARILENFVDGISFPEIRRQFLRDLPPSSIKVALDIARHGEAIYTACPLVRVSSPPALGCHQAPAAIQDSPVDVFAMVQQQSRDIGTQTAQWQWGPPQPTPHWRGSPQPTSPWRSSPRSPRRGYNVVVRPTMLS
uniref:HTH OST-type domain-containing protein n=1 Tax=Schistocephalus solidus TaxID=70667 RepID=A0A183SDT4_SCHSO